MASITVEWYTELPPADAFDLWEPIPAELNTWSGVYCIGIYDRFENHITTVDVGMGSPIRSRLIHHAKTASWHFSQDEVLLVATCARVPSEYRRGVEGYLANRLRPSPPWPTRYPRESVEVNLPRGWVTPQLSWADPPERKPSAFRHRLRLPFSKK